MRRFFQFHLLTLFIVMLTVSFSMFMMLRPTGRYAEDFAGSDIQNDLCSKGFPLEWFNPIPDHMALNDFVDGHSESDCLSDRQLIGIKFTISYNCNTHRNYWCLAIDIAFWAAIVMMVAVLAERMARRRDKIRTSSSSL